MKDICASIFTIPERRERISATDLWQEIASDISHEYAECYLFDKKRRFRICLLQEASLSPDKKYVRYRTIDASVRRKSGHPTLLDLCVGNLYSLAENEKVEAVHIVNEMKYAKWARSAGAISLSEHVRLIKQFIADLMDAGWLLSQAILKPATVGIPSVRNAKGVSLLPEVKASQLVREPSYFGEKHQGFCVVHPNENVARRAAERLSSAFSRIFAPRYSKQVVIHIAPSMSEAMTNLVLLDDESDLGSMPEFRAMLSVSEASGVRFKLAKLGSIYNDYPANNIAYDLFIISGGRPWTPVESQLEFCSIDAGHDREKRVSRWTKVEVDSMMSDISVRFFDTTLAEHIPEDLVEKLWPLSRDAVFCRDGRLSQEKGVMTRRAIKEERPILEVKKSARAIIWRQQDDKVLVANFGDAVVDEQGEYLLQTVPQNIKDYIHPVRLSSSSGVSSELATSFINQHIIPGLSLYRMSRLPGSLYYADLVSKLSSDGWPKVIGRGFDIPGVIPK